jgi:formylglycine-generating enzyme required for sulfatase activity
MGMSVVEGRRLARRWGCAWKRWLGSTLPLSLALLALTSCGDLPEPLLCQGITCSHHGRCVIDRVEVSCECEDGFREGSDLTCLPDEVEVGRWVLVERPVIGVFVIGSPSEEVGRQDDEDRHSVTFSRDFVVLEQEVTLEIYLEEMGSIPPGSELDPDNSEDLQRPIDHLSWHEAAAFCNRLSNRRSLQRCYLCAGEGDSLSCELDPAFETPQSCLGYRLPTESEWEVAARAGTSTATPGGDLDERHLGCEDNPVLGEVAAFCGNARMSRPVERGSPSAWGLYDMLGNVSEWCHDWYDRYPQSDEVVDPFGPSAGGERVFRGGSYDDRAADVRTARRFHISPQERRSTVGFRPVRSVVER